jgi:hypothetical protein
VSYSPKIPPTVNTLNELRDWLQDELRLIAQEFGETTLLNLRPVHREPERPRDGMIAYADGTDWNPGAGVGFYGRQAGAWVKL